MTSPLVNLRLLDYIGDVDPKTGRVRISREARQVMQQIASEAAKQTTYGVNVATQWRSDANGVFPGPDPAGPWPTGLVADLLVPFYTESTLVATHTIRGFLTTATGLVHASTLGFTGEATSARFVEATSGDTVRIDVTHVASGAIASATFSAIDNSTAGQTPATIDFGGGGGDPGGGGVGPSEGAGCE